MINSFKILPTGWHAPSCSYFIHGDFTLKVSKIVNFSNDDGEVFLGIEMVCGPDPPENNHDLIPPPRHDLYDGHGDDSDDERQENFGYQPLPQGPDAIQSDHDNSEDEEENSGSQSQLPRNDVPPIETMDAAITREVWNAPRSSQSIEMDPERAQQVMSAMANFALPQASIPEWAQSITEEQWKQTLKDRLDILKGNR